ncbi:putative membrane protein [Azospirillaceae bacterium]
MNLNLFFPHVTATLNGVSALLLMVAYGMIRADRRKAHRFVMLCAVVVSALFLACYLVYHFTAPIFVFAGQGMVRSLYYVLLISHVVLALVIVPMIVLTLSRALGGGGLALIKRLQDGLFLFGCMCLCLEL